MACTALIPVTVLKLRSEVETKVAASITDIYRREGARGLTRGLLPTILRDAPFSGLYMMMYDIIRKAGTFINMNPLMINLRVEQSTYYKL